MQDFFAKENIFLQKNKFFIECMTTIYFNCIHVSYKKAAFIPDASIGVLRRNSITIKKSSVVTLLKKLIVFCYNMLNPTVIKSHHHSDDIFIITSQYTYCLDPRYHEIINQYNAWIIKYFNL